MRVNVRGLRGVVRGAVSEDKAIRALRVEIRSVLGHSVSIDKPIGELALDASERLSVLESTGRSPRTQFKTSVVLALVEHPDPRVRRLVAHALPERFLGRLMEDPSPLVRNCVAKRGSPGVLFEMIKRTPHDESLQTILNDRMLAEANKGIKTPKVIDEPFDMYGDDRLTAAKQDEGDELSDAWYKTVAFNMMQDYGDNIEYAWEELAVKQFVQNTLATSGVIIDGEKLLKTIKDMIEDAEDESLARSTVSESVVDRRLMYTEKQDIVSEMMSSKPRGQELIRAASTVFNIKESTIPGAIKKHASSRQQQTIPVVGTLPHTYGFRAIDEQALDAFCKAWNDRQLIENREPLRLEWTMHPDSENKVSFCVVLR